MKMTMRSLTALLAVAWLLPAAHAAPRNADTYTASYGAVLASDDPLAPKTGGAEAPAQAPKGREDNPFAPNAGPAPEVIPAPRSPGDAPAAPPAAAPAAATPIAPPSSVSSEPAYAPGPSGDAGPSMSCCCENCCTNSSTCCGTSCCTNSCTSDCCSSCGWYGFCHGCLCDKIDCPDCPGWTLFGDDECLKCHDLTINGWINGGYTYNANGRADHFNGPVTFNDRADEGMLNQAYISLTKNVKIDSCCFNWGGKVDLMYGTDSRYTKAIGLELDHQGNDRWNSERFYQLSMPQLYAEFAHCNWDLKVGRFYTIAGYESAPAPNNFFYSHSYCFQYGEPITQTGFLLTHVVNDQFSISAGFHRGWDQFEDFQGEEGSGAMLGLNFQTKDARTKLAIAWIQSDEIAPFVGIVADRNLITTVFTHQFTDRLTNVKQFDYGWQNEGANNGANTAKWYGYTDYMMYQINCCWWLGMRAEWFQDPEGTRVSNFVSGNTAVGPFDGTFTELTFGLNYKPNGGKNLTVRPEVRWDHYDGPAGSVLPFDNGTKDNQFLMAVDAIFKF